jgi:hypothetical protein
MVHSDIHRQLYVACSLLHLDVCRSHRFFHGALDLGLIDDHREILRSECRRGAAHQQVTPERHSGKTLRTFGLQEPCPVSSRKDPVFEIGPADDSACVLRSKMFRVSLDSRLQLT